MPYVEDIFQANNNLKIWLSPVIQFPRPCFNWRRESCFSRHSLSLQLVTLDQLVEIMSSFFVEQAKLAFRLLSSALNPLLLSSGMSWECIEKGVLGVKDFFFVLQTFCGSNIEGSARLEESSFSLEVVIAHNISSLRCRKERDYVEIRSQ